MWSAAAGLQSVVVLAVFASTLGLKGEQVFDVTTIYDVGNVCFNSQDTTLDPSYGADEVDSFRETGKSCDSNVTGRVHKRTNANGLPLDILSSLMAPRNQKLRNFRCDPLNLCNWDKEGWSTEFTTSLAMQENLTYTFWKQFEFEIKSSSSGDLYILFTNGSLNLRQENAFHVLKVRNSYINGLFYSKCKFNSQYYNQYQLQMKDRDGSPLAVHCSSRSNVYNTLKVTIDDDDKIKFYGDNSNSPYRTDSVTEIKYFSYYSDHSLQSPLIKIPVLSTRKLNSELVSPMIDLQTNRLCLVLILHFDEDIRSDQLQVLVEDQSGARHLVHTVRGAKAGWSVIHINENIQEHVVRIIIKAMDSQEVSIRLISFYDPDDNNVEILPPTRLSRRQLASFNRLSTYSVPFDILAEPKLEGTNSCKHGGEMTSAGCACPPGFAGPLCESGCGRNRFGQDCGGICSFRTRECEGLVLCSPITRCSCAPGYEGDFCNEHCSPGWYGNSCSQRCGHCVPGSFCDIYTGECSQCDLGYLTPHCTEAYVYYSEIPIATSSDYRKITVSFNPQHGISGYGKPKMYQIQYREVSHDWITHVTKLMPSEDEGDVEETIEDLRDGVFYQVRVLLMDASYNKYDGELVQISQALTKCDIPEVFDYDIKAATNTSSFTFSWTYNNKTEHWCPVEYYEVSWEEDWQQLTDNTQDTAYTLTGFLPYTTVEFKVRAKTRGGFAPFSSTVSGITRPNGSAAVRGLSMTSSQTSSVELSWRPPIGTEGRKLRYIVTYKCVDQLACSPECQEAIEEQVTQEDTRVTLNGLLPFSQYLVTVSPEDGQPSKIFAGTDEAVPTERPNLSTRSPARTNTSLTVYWDPVTVCSSHFTGYNYQLLKESDSLQVLNSGFTRDTTASFHNLTASTRYIVRVFVVTIAGWNPQAYLSINTSTSATVPEAVRDLTVYKRGRNMLGLRWAAPEATYGALKSFTVTHSLGKNVISRTVDLTPCVVWPNLFCNTINDLRPNCRYNITVRARNVDVAEDGTEAIVDGLTKETSPSPPENLKMINSSSTSVGLSWDHPDLANGIIRTFVVSVEETEKFDQDSCCQVYPLVEIPVTEEKASYDVEVSGLHPASTYFVSVSAKTVGLGPSQSLVVTTRPPHLPFTVSTPQLPDEGTLQLRVDNGLWLPQDRQPELNNSEVYTPLIKAHLLLVVPSNSQTPINDSCILDSKLDSLLHSLIDVPFWFYKEYDQEEYMDESDWGGSLGCLSLSKDQEYQLLAVQVTEYNGTYNAEFRSYSKTMRF